MTTATANLTAAVRKLYAAKRGETIRRNLASVADLLGVTYDAAAAAYTAVLTDGMGAAALRDALIDELTAAAVEIEETMDVTAAAVEDTAAVWSAAVSRMRRNYHNAAALHMFPNAAPITALRYGRNCVHMDDIAAAAFRDAAAAVGLEDLTDDSAAVEQGRQYQSACVVLTKGRGKRADVLESVRIPATRGRVNVCAWYTALNGGHVPTPNECPAAYVSAEPTHKTARIYRAADGSAVCVKCTRDGRPIPRKVGIESFVRDYLAPIIGAYVWMGTESGCYNVGYDDNAHRVTF